MRFVENGPFIPDDLLIARDQGRVVFFCGAGVSRAKAGLPDFYGLAKSVINNLGVSSEHSVRKFLVGLNEFENTTGIPGLVSVDRLFGLLEREFSVSDIQREVSLALNPGSSPDTSAHQILLDLATTQEGIIRLVTTNFDRLFDDCGRSTKSWIPSNLPNPKNANDFNGVVYLHGKASINYESADSVGYVLSSSDFGRAYLSEGWATSFIKEIVKKYVVVFVGYTADDPPVTYLLEALCKEDQQLGKVYAFQAGSDEEAQARWRHKGVCAISYANEDGNHSSLWESLSAWASKARDPQNWLEKIVDMARKGPRDLKPHERGQVAHIVSTFEGAKQFADCDCPPPAEWLCVFDRWRRYAKPGHMWDYDEEGAYVDPFELYCIDSDKDRNDRDLSDYKKHAQFIATVWDALEINNIDKILLNDKGFCSLREDEHSRIRLPKRLRLLGIWISKVAHQKATIWWATRQFSLSSFVRDNIDRKICQNANDVDNDVRKVWSYLLERWERTDRENKREMHGIKNEILASGWSRSVARRYCDLICPCFKIDSGLLSWPIPPSEDDGCDVSRLIHLSVNYAENNDFIEIPDEWLHDVAVRIRKNLEVAVDLELEIGGYGLHNIAPIRKDDNPEIDQYLRRRGLSGYLIVFSEIFKRLIVYDQVAAKRDFSSWPHSNNYIFGLLRIWLAGDKSMVPVEEFGDFFITLDDEFFWSVRLSRDLLLTFTERWSDLNESMKKSIEQRLLKGPSQWEGEDQDKYENRKAWSILNRINWLDKNGCQLSVDVAEETKRLSRLAPKWKEKYAGKTVESIEPKGGYVSTETNCKLLLNIPLDNILSKADELSARDYDSFVQKDPFLGLAEQYPRRAFSAIRRAVKRNNCHEWAWSKFLYADSRKRDSQRLVGLIAGQLICLRNDDFSKIIRHASHWFDSVSEALVLNYYEIFYKFVDKVVATLSEFPECGTSNVVRSSGDRDWATEAINSPSGRLATVLLKDCLTDDFKDEKRFAIEWQSRATYLLALPGDVGRFVLVIFMQNINWFYFYDDNWSKEKLLSVMLSNDNGDRDAFWSGFFMGAKVPQESLYVLIKPSLLKIIKKGGWILQQYGQVASGVLLSGWWSNIKSENILLITDEEYRDVLLNTDEDFRINTLWTLERWLEDGSRTDITELDNLFLRFINNVWPRQKYVKSARISARLFDFAFTIPSHFEKYTGLIMPLLVKASDEYLMLPNMNDSLREIVDRCPELLLDLFCAVLPDDASFWPHDMGEVLDKIQQVNANMIADPRILELKRKWGSANWQSLY